MAAGHTAGGAWGRPAAPPAFHVLSPGKSWARAVDRARCPRAHQGPSPSLSVLRGLSTGRAGPDHHALLCRWAARGQALGCCVHLAWGRGCISQPVVLALPTAEAGGQLKGGAPGRGGPGGPGAPRDGHRDCIPTPDRFLGVYAFGFLFMLPQLFVNYKVRRTPSRRPRVPELPGRSRAHLPADEVGGAPALESLHLQGQPPAASARPCRPASVAAAGDGLGPSQASRQHVPEQGCSQRRGRASGGPSLGPGRQGHPCTGAGTTWPPRASAHGPGRVSAPVLGVGTQSKCPSVSPAEWPWPAAGCRAVGPGHQQPGWLPAPGGAPRGPGLTPAAAAARRLSTPSLTTCSPSSSPCPPPTGWPASGTTWCFSCTCTSDGERGSGMAGPPGTCPPSGSGCPAGTVS